MLIVLVAVVLAMQGVPEGAMGTTVPSVTGLSGFAQHYPDNEPFNAAPQSPLEVVALHRGDAPGPLAPIRLLTILRAIAADLNALTSPRSYGVLRKTTGTNCLGYSCDIICHVDGRQFDVFVDVEGSASPTWQQVKTPNPQGGCEIADVPTDPPPPPVDLEPLLKQLAAMKDELAVLRGVILGLNEWSMETDKHISALLSRPIAVPLVCGPLSTGRAWGHSHQVTACVEKRQ